MRGVALGVVPLLLAACSVLSGAPAPGAATASLQDAAGRTVGTATLIQVGDAVRILMEVRSLPPGPKAVHIHAVGRCQPPDFASAGGHFDPTGREHGLLNPRGPHAGDLASVTVGADGQGRLETTTEMVSLLPGPTSLLDPDGSALVVHARGDDFRTDPTGDSGDRIACGVIRRS